MYSYCHNDGVNGVDPSGHKCYIFNANKEKHMRTSGKKIKTALKKYYGKNEGVVNITVNGKVGEKKGKYYKDFRKSWNKMMKDSKNIKCVVINSHATPDFIMNKAGDDFFNSIEIGYVRNHIPYLILVSCNAGHLDYSTNVATNVAKIIKGGRVIAADGTVHVNTRSNDIRMEIRPQNDNEFKALLSEQENPRKPRGFLVFSYSNGVVWRSESLGFSFGISSVLEKAKKASGWAKYW